MWREKLELDTIDEWEGPEFLVKYFPHGMVGYDKEGSPIILIPYGGIDIWGLLHSATKHDIVKRTVKLLEGFMGIAYRQSLLHGIEARKFVVIFDMEGFSMRHYAYRPAAELAIQVFQMYSNNYPEILKCCYVINGESLYTASRISLFAHLNTIFKINLLHSTKNLLVCLQHRPQIPRRVYDIENSNLQHKS